MSFFSNMMNWDPVMWMSILMVILAIVIIIFLGFKVKALMEKDAEAHKREGSKKS
ncbi:MAG: hypothetical protein WAT23_08540 [Chromatiaceae bacterium]